MRFAYADPPYIGQAKRLYNCDEIDHSELLNKLQTYDGWALSMSATMISLKQIIGLAPDDARLAAWVKPWCSFKTLDPAYTWEPILYKTQRKHSKEQDTIKDHLICNITLRKGLCGAKPQEFCFWLFELLGMKADDELDDLFPGTGIVTECWNHKKTEAERKQLKLF
jgi:hypothetical protein